MNTYIKTLLDSFGNQLFPRTRVDAVYLEDNTTELGDHLQTKQDAPTSDKTTPVDGDKALIYDSANSNAPKKLSWANIKATLKTYFDTIYSPKASPTFTGTPIAPTAVAGTNTTQIATTAFVQQEVATLTTLTQTHTQTESIKSLPTGSLDGKVSNFKADGLSLVNSVVNGDFSGGATGWTAQASTHSVSNNVLTNIGDGSLAVPYENTSLIPYVSNTKMYISAIARTTNTSATNLILLAQVFKNGSWIGNNNIKAQATPISGQWYFLSGILQDSRDVNQLSILLQHTYTDASTANGKVMEVDGNAGVFAINMTALGIASYTEAQMLDLVRGGYFDGLKGVENPTFESVGKNLFDKTKATLGVYREYNSGLLINNLSSFASGFIPVIEGQTYCSDSIYSHLCFFNKNKDYIGGVVITDSPKYWVIPVGCAYITISNDSTPIDSFQIEEGTVATAYEKFKNSKLSIKETLRSLPNGVCDRIVEY